MVMKKYLVAGILAATMATGAQAQSNLTSATVTGPSGTVWNTNAADTFYTLFLVRPFGTILNPNDNFSGSASTLGANNFTTAGEGFPTGGSMNSDPFYTLTLMFANGAQITGQYVGSVFTGGTSSAVGGFNYTLTGFGWDRSPADNVSAYRAVSGGDPADYTGQFAYSVAAVAAVPEPATWAMMLLGFGGIGFAMRRRSQVRTTVSYA